MKNESIHEREIKEEEEIMKDPNCWCNKCFRPIYIANLEGECPHCGSRCFYANINTSNFVRVKLNIVPAAPIGWSSLRLRTIDGGKTWGGIYVGVPDVPLKHGKFGYYYDPS